jgi:hypothetical protein
VSLRALRLELNASTAQPFESGAGRWSWLQIDALRGPHRLGAFLLDYREAFRYRIAGVQIEPEMSLLSGLVAVRPMLGLARWTSDSLTQSFPAAGATLQLLKSVGDVVFRLTGSVHHAGENGYASGVYASVGADTYVNVGEITLSAGFQRGENPITAESGFHVSASHPVGAALRIDAAISRPLADAVFGSPGSLGFSVGGAYRVWHRAYVPPPAVAKVGAPASSGRVVEFRVRLPDARGVAVSGTFSDWQPIELRRTGNEWVGQVSVEPGTHQYGFLVDGEHWYLPPDVKDVIDDGFGRKNATLVVQPK